MTESGRNVGPTNNNQAVQAGCRLALHSALITSVVMRVYRRRYVYFIPYNAHTRDRAGRKLPDCLWFTKRRRLFSWHANFIVAILCLCSYILSPPPNISLRRKKTSKVGGGNRVRGRRTIILKFWDSDLLCCTHLMRTDGIK